MLVRTLPGTIAYLQIFLILQSTFGGLYNNFETPTYTCATSEDQKSEISGMEIVSILYKAIFACYCMAIACVFCYYGVRTLLAVHSTAVDEKDSIVMKVYS